MELTITTKELREAFATAATLAPNRTPKPILQNVLLTAKSGWLSLTGTDSEKGIRVTLKCDKIRQDGRCLINAAKGTALLRELSGEETTIRDDNGVVEIRSGTTKSRLQSASTDEFPDFPSSPEKGLQIRSHAFSEAIARTAFACDAASTRYALGAVCLEQKGQSVTLIATDTRRMPVARITAENAFQLDEQLLFPAGFIGSVRKILVESDPLVTIAKSGSTVTLTSGNTELFARMVEGRFPKWESVIPQSIEHTVQIAASALLSAIRQVSVTTNEESKGLTFDFAADSLVISSQAADLGASSTALPIQNGPALKIVMDGRLIADWLKCFDAAAVVEIGLTDADTAVLMTYGEQKYVVMPLAQGE